MSQHPVAVSIRLPYPPYLWKVARRSVVMWLLVRCAYAGVLMAAMAFGLLPPAEGIDQVLYPAWPMRILLVALTAFFVYWDRRRAHELLLPPNLGAWPGWFWTASLLVALVVDIVVQSILAAL